MKVRARKESEGKGKCLIYGEAYFFTISTSSTCSDSLLYQISRMTEDSRYAMEPSNHGLHMSKKNRYKNKDGTVSDDLALRILVSHGSSLREE